MADLNRYGRWPIGKSARQVLRIIILINDRERSCTNFPTIGSVNRETPAADRYLGELDYGTPAHGSHWPHAGGDFDGGEADRATVAGGLLRSIRARAEGEAAQGSN